MKRSVSILKLLVVALILTACSNNSHREKPNVVLIFIDDMGWADFSCFGNKDALTPNMDELASEGIRFEHFYVNSPICSPSRVAISTGQYPQRYNITSYLAHRAQNADRGIANWLDPSAPMLARSLKETGYATGHFGKWHMGGQRDVTDAPAIKEYGFDEALTNFEGMGAKLLPLTIDETGKVDTIWKKAVSLGNPVTWMQRSEITTGFIDAAISFIDRSKEEGKPFYINIWPDDVHTPLWPPYEVYGTAKEAGKKGLYLAVLEAMDKQFGKLFNYIKSDEDLKENTLILVCSDNGPEPGAGQAGVLKGYKTQLYEGGIRSPLIVWGPSFVNGRLNGTTNSESVFSAIDLVPSILDFTGTDPVKNIQYDGEILIKTILGQSESSRDEPLFFSRPSDRKSFYGFENLPDLAMREGKWKLLCDYDGSRPELYDITKDPGEKTNLAGTNPDIVRSMTRELDSWWTSMPQIESDYSMGRIKKWSESFRNWNYYPDLVIPPNPQIKGFEDVMMTDVPTVFQLPGDDRWYMSFVGFDGQGYQSFIAESDDLIHWANYRLAMGYGPEGSFDYVGVVLGAYLYEDYNIKSPRTLKAYDPGSSPGQAPEGMYWSLYGAYPRQGGYELRPGYEGVAVSKDGLHWERAKDEPILSVYDNECGEWEQSCIYQPWMVEHNGRFFNLYNAANGKVEQMGLAVSEDLLKWNRYGSNPVIPNGPEGAYNEVFSSDIKVFWDRDHWVGFFFGVGRGGAHIMAAYSPDLYHWTVDPDPLYKAGGNPSGIDGRYAHKISLVWNPENESYFMFYCAVDKDGNRGIGLIADKKLIK